MDAGQTKSIPASFSAAFAALSSWKNLYALALCDPTSFVASAAAFSIVSFSFAQVAEDFEAGWDQSAWPIYATDCNQGGKVTLDTTTAHSGKNSIRVDGAGGFCGHIFFGTTKVPAGDVYVRAYV